LTSLEDIKDDYKKCQSASKYCVNGTMDERPSLIPVINDFVGDLNDLLANVTNSTSDPNCLGPILNDTKFLIDQLINLNGSLLSRSFSSEVTLLTQINASIAILNYNFTLCQPDNRTVFIDNTTQLLSNLQGLLNETLNSNVDPDCLAIVQFNISQVIGALNDFKKFVFEISFEQNQGVLEGT
jgi:hypothetical protein